MKMTIRMGTSVMASKDEKPTLLLLGHSYANHLYPGLLMTDGFSQHSILSIGTCEPDDTRLSFSETTTDDSPGVALFDVDQYGTKVGRIE